jgi:type I restriction enzyme S subunit
MTILPASWSSTSIASLCATAFDGPFGSNLKSADYSESGVRVVRLENIGHLHFREQLRTFITRAKYRSLAKNTLFENDVVFSSFVDEEVRVCLIPRALGLAINKADCFCLRIDRAKALPQFIAYRLATPDTYADFRGMVRGVTRPRINISHLKKYAIAVPPISEQLRIVKSLDSLIGSVDKCRARLDRVRQILMKFREAVLEAAVTGRLTEEWRGQQTSSAVDAKPDVETILNAHIAAGGHRAGNAALPTSDVHDLDGSMFPKEWGLIDLRDAIEPGRPITYGILKPGPEVSDGVSYVRVADYPGNRLNLNTVRKTSRLIESEFARARLRTGDLLLSIRGTVGRLIVIPSELEGANITQDSARLSIQESLNKEFVRFYLSSPIAQQRMRRATKGVAVRGINIGDVRALQLPVPVLSEQLEISRRVNELFALADSLQRRYENTASFTERLTPSVLAKAFRGELVLQDSSDEPVEEMFERARSAGSTNWTRKNRAAGRNRG